ncbi:TonB-dependent receptor [Bradyrhizobium viridifuturi]|jgi:iron complex outermembrane recepter protein|nr:MAG: iron complex outermembrane recepter protein [Bradyrhizobium sp. DFCI-1]MBR1022258.1 TonB-dependent receptor [Bradyrhizobium viridifuturi]MCA3569417.1 TonB-dependent receptor [Bradyrhizobium sp.]OYU59071.1 MAG: TonB-dependent receptor [Bradyrhizobium sp. PARBB1]PSO27713.1 TonB-dependent receptor [Bradyrhizobium sp. MOS004]QRI69279.1 TonB-dependent receptor [Bradyrhizobium sp. PSBB068]
MFCYPARRRRALLLASTMIVPSIIISAARAQQAPAPDQLPAIEVTKPGDQNVTRAKPAADQTPAPRRPAPGTTQSNNAGSGSGSGATGTGVVTGTGDAGGGRQFAGIVGSSSTVITADDIAHSPVQSLPEILAQVPGVQLQTPYGGPNGAKTSVDLRGFGAFASDNTLFLLNGRRLNDVDKAGFDLTTIPLDSIARIEIVRGNSGAVLYGDNAVGGVVNIITKTGAGGPPATIRAEGGFGSFNSRMAAVSAALNSGPWSTSFYGNGIKSDGYRVNNALDQRNAVGSVNYTTSDLIAFLTVTGSDQKLGLPGGRLVDPSIGVNQLLTDRRGAATPFDYANQQTASVTAGFTKTLTNGVDLIVDGGWRQRETQSGFFGTVPTISFASTYNDAALQTWSLTPRLSIKNVAFGMPSTILTGIDYYDSTFREARGAYQGVDPFHIYNIEQQTVAGYWQHTLGLLPTTDFSYGARVQNTNVSARDRYDPNAPFAFDTQASPLGSNETQYAAHVGIEHRFTDTFSVFGRAARAFRTPDVDERVLSGPGFDAFFNPLPQNFQLKTQTSEDVEGGFRVKTNLFQVQTSVYLMDLENEIHFNPVLFYNVNLDPTRRYGSETSASLKVSDSVTLRGGMAITRAVFRDGMWAGNDVPLVSRYTGNIGLTWNIWQNYLVFDATVRAWSSRIMDNDQANTQSRIPGNATADLKLSGQVDRFFWSLSVNNLFNALYYDYAIASSFTAGRFSAYPLPGRTYMVKAGATF